MGCGVSIGRTYSFLFNTNISIMAYSFHSNLFDPSHTKFQPSYVTSRSLGQPSLLSPLITRSLVPCPYSTIKDVLCVSTIPAYSVQCLDARSQRWVGGEFGNSESPTIKVRK